LVILAFSLVSSIHFAPTEGTERQFSTFESYVQFFNKTYSTRTGKFRAFKNYLQSISRVAQRNEEARRLGANTVFGLTQFSDMSVKEFKDTVLMPVKAEHKSKREDEQNPTTPIDWVAKGMTTPIKNQLQCGSCWTFSATETIESANLIAGKITTSTWLAPQQIVDCDTGGSGCNGGWPNQAMQWIIQQGGQDTEASYPYTGQDGSCAESSGKIGATITAVNGPINSESQMYQQLGSTPLSICADAEPWQDYQGGILTAAQCSTSIDHAIQLTGYNPSQGGYWIVRNSWGASWGESGFIWLQYGQDTCGITSYVYWATA